MVENLRCDFRISLQKFMPTTHLIFEPGNVELLGIDVELVAGTPCLEDRARTPPTVGLQRRAQTRDVDAECILLPISVVAPDRLDCRHDLRPAVRGLESPCP